MLIHDHSERVPATTAQASATEASVTIEPRDAFLPALSSGEQLAFGFGWLLLGVIVGWSINQARVVRLKGQRDRFAKRWVRACERVELSKEVIARMVNEESEDRRPRSSAVA